MIKPFQALEQEYDMLPPGGKILCAVSGGADSMCLLHLVQSLAGERGLTVAAAHFNHRLRGRESDRDEAFVRDYCAREGVLFFSGAGEVSVQAQRLGQGIEETARQLRYAFLFETAAQLGYHRIATAHNAGDNVETLLHHLVRGTGLQGLTGIAPRRGELVRPLLTTSREEIEAYLSEHSLSYVVDRSNADTAFTRNKLRQEVLPILRQLNPRLDENLSDTIRYLRQDNDYLNARAAEVCRNARWAEDDLVIEAHYLADCPSAIAPRCARRLLEMLGDGDTDCTAAHLNAIVDLCRGDDPSAVIFLPDGKLAQRVYRELLLTRQKEVPPPFEPVSLCTDGETQAARWRVTCRPTVCPDGQDYDALHFYLRKDAVGPGAILRPRRQGDEISLPGRGTKTIKKLFIDEKIPRMVREQIPLLADGDGLLAVAGFGPDASRLAKPGENAYEIRFTQIEKREG